MNFNEPLVLKSTAPPITAHVQSNAVQGRKNYGVHIGSEMYSKVYQGYRD